jgi:oxygen-independent coproporphyrinogen-3 oxidase
MAWYEVSNWARPGGECRHNLGYWAGDGWWGIGPGAHSHLGGVRWWNVKHPSTYAGLLAEGRSPEAEREELTAEQRNMERVMLGLRLSGGLPLDAVSDDAASRVPDLVARGLLDPEGVERGRLALTLRGRLLADAVIRDLVP